MYTTFIGGISVYDFNDTTSVLVYDTVVPFINDITTLTVDGFGIKSEAIMDTHLSGLLGSNAKFISNGAISHYSNDVIRINSMTNNVQMLAGYMFGGIRANAGNFGITLSNDSIYRVYITPHYTTGVDETSMNVMNAQLYPNPSTDVSTLSFVLKNAETVRVSITDVTGKEVQLIANEKMNSGSHQFKINTSKLTAGLYICKVGVSHLSLVISR